MICACRESQNSVIQADRIHVDCAPSQQDAVLSSSFAEPEQLYFPLYPVVEVCLECEKSEVIFSNDRSACVFVWPGGQNVKKQFCY